MAQERVLYFDVLNVVAGFGVVVMHFNGLVHSFEPTFDWAQSLLFNCLFYWAVPAFLMLSGATLLDYRDRYTTREFLVRRALRVLVPFVAWSLIALVWKVLTAQMEPPVGPRSLLDLVFNSKIIDVYWYFIPLMVVYLCLPVLSLLREQRRALWYLVAVGATLNYAAPLLFAAIGVPWNVQAELPLAGGLLIYPVLGYLLRDEPLGRRERLAIYILGLVGLLARFVHTAVASYAEGTLVTLTWEYDNLPCLLQSAAVFVLFRQVRWGRVLSTEQSQRTLKSVAGCTFGIYLTHMFVFWYGLRLTPFDGSDIEWRLFGPIVAYGICLALVMAARRVPLLKRIL